MNKELLVIYKALLNQNKDFTVPYVNIIVHLLQNYIDVGLTIQLFKIDHISIIRYGTKIIDVAEHINERRTDYNT